MSFYINFSLIRTGIPLICAAKVRNSDVRTEQIGSCCITKNTETIKWGQQIKKGKKKYHNFQSSRTFSWFQNYSMIPKGWLLWGRCFFTELLYTVWHLQKKGKDNLKGIRSSSIIQKVGNNVAKVGLLPGKNLWKAGIGTHGHFVVCDDILKSLAPS